MAFQLMSLVCQRFLPNRLSLTVLSSGLHLTADCHRLRLIRGNLAAISIRTTVVHSASSLLFYNGYQQLV